MIKLHPLGTESRYSLDMACSILYGYKPRSVRLYADDVEMVEAAARRCAWLEGSLMVNTPALAEAIQGFPGIQAAAEAKTDVDAALVLFPEAATLPLPKAKHLILVCFNALSYKGALHPGSIRGTVFQWMGWLKQSYVIDQTVGLFTPTYLARWSISTLAGARFPALHFRAGQIALDHLFVCDWTWRSGSIVIMAGHRR